jgi:hypothetical protein
VIFSQHALAVGDGLLRQLNRPCVTRSNIGGGKVGAEDQGVGVIFP